VEASSAAAVFVESLAALGELIAVEDATEPARHEISASAPDRATLLAEWLNELVYLVETEGFVPEGVEGLDLRENSLAAAVTGRRGSPPHLVKAVTYHRLAMWEENGAWRARVIFDV
jgi:SHS2 domain-containing protein